MPRTATPRKPRESAEARAARVARILAMLRRAYPDANCALEHRTPFQLLVATILSAQCTDVRVNIVTKELFARYPDAESLAAAPRPTLERLVHSTGFFRNKAKNLKGTARQLVAEHGGRVPDTMEALLALPGVARKTANVVLGNAYGKNEGVVVDTHVGRLSRRLGLTTHDDPVKVERDLMALVPRADWTWVAHALILHGRAICGARGPRCGECPLAPDCPSAAAG